MSKNPRLTWSRIAVPVAIGLAIDLAGKRLIPPAYQTRYQHLSVPGALAVVMLAGGYVALAAREDDIAHYRAIGADTPEKLNWLDRRRRMINVVGWVLAACGGILLALVVVRLASN